MQAERGLGYGCRCLSASWRSHLWHSCFKRDLHEADGFSRFLPTAKAAGYASTAPTRLTPSGIADFVSQIEF